MTFFTVDGAGTTRTASGTITIGAPSQNDTLVRELHEKIKRDAEQIHKLEQALKEALDKQTNLDFTKEELAFILSRVHPDKNPDSKIATTLTSKLIKGRK